MSIYRGVVAAALLVRAYAQTCPEPVKQLLGKGELWELHLFGADCAFGHSGFDGVTPSGLMYGDWLGFCESKDTDSPNFDLIITTEPHGLGSGCSTDEDCAFIPCTTVFLPCPEEGCIHSHECMATADDCRIQTEWNIKPSEFESACPPDPRASMCTEAMLEFDGMGCDIFFDAVDDAHPPTEGMCQIATRCLQLLYSYTSCVTEKFADSPAYLTHRMPPADVSSYIYNVIAAQTNEKCVVLPQELALRPGAIPCGGR